MATYDNIQHVLSIKKYLTQDDADELYTKKETHEEYEHDREIKYKDGSNYYLIYGYEFPDFTATTYSMNITYERINNNNKDDVEYKSIVFNVVNREVKEAIDTSSNEAVKKLSEIPDALTSVDVSIKDKNNQVISSCKLEHLAWLYDVDIGDTRNIFFVVYLKNGNPGCEDYYCINSVNINYERNYYISSITYSNILNNGCSSCATNNADAYKVIHIDDTALTLQDDVYSIDLKGIDSAQSVIVDALVYDVPFVVQTSIKNMGSDDHYDDDVIVNKVRQHIRLHVFIADSVLKIYATTVDTAVTPNTETKIDASKLTINYIAIHK